MQIFKTHKIAVFLSSSGDISNFFECDHFSVFQKSGSDWNIERTEKFKIASFDSVKMLRNELSSVISCISDCNVVAGGELTGVAFSAFDMAGFHIFNINDISDETLSGILEDIEKGNSEEKYKQEIIKNACPIETETPGIYFLDLILLQTECPEISSKKSMMNFLENTPFLELKLICKHIPPWIENSGKYAISQTRQPDRITAVITKKQCN